MQGGVLSWVRLQLLLHPLQFPHATAVNSCPEKLWMEALKDRTGLGAAWWKVSLLMERGLEPDDL